MSSILGTSLQLISHVFCSLADMYSPSVIAFELLSIRLADLKRCSWPTGSCGGHLASIQPPVASRVLAARRVRPRALRSAQGRGQGRALLLHWLWRWPPWLHGLQLCHSAGTADPLCLASCDQDYRGAGVRRRHSARWHSAHRCAGYKIASLRIAG